MSPSQTRRSVRSWQADSSAGPSAQDLFRRREVWLFAFILLFVLLLFIWQRNSTYQLASELASLEAEHRALRSSVLGLGTSVEDLRQPASLLAGLDEDRGSQDLRGRVMVAAGPRPGAPVVPSRHEQWLASLGLTVPTALADEVR